MVNLLAGCARWTLEFLGWLCDALFGLLDDNDFMAFLAPGNSSHSLVNMTRYLHAKKEIALHLILCSSTRNLISAVCRRVDMVHGFASRALNWYSSKTEMLTDGAGSRHMALHAAYRKVYRHTSSALIKADEFEKFLTTLSSDIRSAYSTALAALAEREAQRVAKNPPTTSQNPNAPKPDRVKEARQHWEMSLLLMQTPPPPFLPVIGKLFRQDLKVFRANTDVAKLYFANYHLLELSDSPEALASKKRRAVKTDIFKRIEISRQAGLTWRQCARCGNVMEDLTSTNNKPGMNFLLSQQRTCCCGGRMALVP